MSVKHKPPSPAALARWDEIPDKSLQTLGMVTPGRCWHKSEECGKYRTVTTSRNVMVNPVAHVTAGEAKACGYGLCSECARLL
jgi:hypothetical protein